MRFAYLYELPPGPLLMASPARIGLPYRSTQTLVKRLRQSLCLVFAWMTVVAYAQEPSLVVLTNLAAVRALSPAAGTNPQPVKVQGTVTYCDPEWRVLFLQDGPAAVFVNPAGSEDDPVYRLRQGQVVEMEGTIVPGLVHCNIAGQRCRVLGEAPLPAPAELIGPKAFNDDMEGRWVRFAGWVVDQSSLGNRIALGVLVPPGRTVAVVLKGMDGASAESLLGNFIGVTGVLALRLNDAGQKTGDYLLLNGSPEVVRKLRQAPILTPGEVTRQFQTLPAGEPVRIRGVLRKRLRDGVLFRARRNQCRSDTGGRQSPAGYVHGKPC